MGVVLVETQLPFDVACREQQTGKHNGEPYDIYDAEGEGFFEEAEELHNG